MLRAYQRIARLYQLNAPLSDTPPPATALERLEHLHLRDTDIGWHGAISNLAALAWFMQLIQPSLSNGSLTSLHITLNRHMERAFDGVLKKSAIRTLSCFDFLDEEFDSSSGNLFATWVRGFPNLTTLGVFPQKTPNCWMHVVKAMSMESKIETIYTDVLTGVWRDETLKKAEEKGIKIIEASRIPEPALQHL
jgi:hypothetical protein